MELKINQANGFRNSIFKDLAKHQYVIKWILAMIDNKACFNPRLLEVEFDDNKVKVIENEELNPDWNDVILDIMELVDLERLEIPSDTLKVTANMKDRELYIKI